jgi:hypothetical protein
MESIFVHPTQPAAHWTMAAKEWGDNFGEPQVDE